MRKNPAPQRARVSITATLNPKSDLQRHQEHESQSVFRTAGQTCASPWKR